MNRPYKYLFVGAAGTTAAPTNRFVGAAGRPGNRPYKYMICRDGLVGAADQTVPTNGYEPLLKIDSVVVSDVQIIHAQHSWLTKAKEILSN